MSANQFLLIVAAGFLIWIAASRFKKFRRQRIPGAPFPTSYIEILQSNMGLYPALPASLKTALHRGINLFLFDKEFVGCDGQEITDEVRLTIAGNACLLVLAQTRQIYPSFKTILVYPSTYTVTQKTHEGEVVFDEHSTRAGESWFRGPIVLSWTDIVHGSKNIVDGQNVVIHEFAHKLDEENGVMDGLPILRDRTHYSEWSNVLNSEYDAFLKRVQTRRNKVIDEYGAISAVEFFAVISESFFEKSVRMKSDLPELYGQLQRFYGLDPASWLIKK
ncbi:MAG: M90 family metallopeptidase [Pseudomonadota bacterium]